MGFRKQTRETQDWSTERWHHLPLKAQRPLVSPEDLQVPVLTGAGKLVDALSLLPGSGFLGSLGVTHTEPTRHICPEWFKSILTLSDPVVWNCPLRWPHLTFMSFLQLARSCPTSASSATHLNPRVGQQPKKIKGRKVYTFFSIDHDVVGWRAGERDREGFTSAPIWAQEGRHSTAM